MKTPTTSSGSNSHSFTVACISTALLAVTGYSYYTTYIASKKQQSKEVGLKSDNDDNDVNDTIVNDQSNKESLPSSPSPSSSSNKKLPSSIPTEIDTSNTNKANDTSLQRIQTTNTITIAYASTTGTCQSFAKSLHESLTQFIESNQKTLSPLTKIQICTVDELDWWDELLNNENSNSNNSNNNNNGEISLSSMDLPPMVIFVLPTWTNGTLPEQYAPLLSSLDEICHDWRVAPRPLRNEEYESMKKSLRSNNNNNSSNGNKRPPMDTKTIQIASFGMGSTAYDKSTFCKPAKDVFKYFMKLGAKSLLVSHGKGVVGMGDDDAGDCKKSFREWKERVTGRIEELWKIQMENHGNNSSSSNSCETKSGCACQSGEGQPSSSNQINEGCCQSGESKINENDEEGFDEDFDEDDDYSDDDYSAQESDYDDDEEKEPDVMDLEDIGNAMQSSTNKNQGSKKVIKEMVTPKQAVALKKEGYKIIGTHSAVKLCRWTKHQLRGRGGCYKHTFYGITSYQCMEATPSLACANKCVFCWRHHKNPVGREWRWKIDDPNEIVDAAVKEHISMIKEAKGIPGVKKDRWQEAHTVRHCALSLVGEPIMYPRIDEFLADLHRRSISSFLVTNGQHPTAIENLRPITQLYVSVDASTPETLEAIDRPLFKDAWERLRQSLRCLKAKGQRTVARLTVVKGWNSDEVAGYAKLIALGHCSLVEVKGVTFCGKSDASNLNMTNTPWHHEVVKLTQTLQKELAKLREAATNDEDRIPEYGLACEHKHSCSVLLARVDQFSVEDPVTGNRKWRTWINYDKFHELAARNAEDPTFKFGVEDYVEDTPSWAIFGAEEEGFDPTDTRHRRKKKYPKYTKFDENGIPTHDDNGNEIDEIERKKLMGLMVAKKKELGEGVSVIDLKGGEKVIDDASLMFRGLTVTK